MTIRAWVAAACLAAALPAQAETAKLRVDFIDVGQGDAALVTSPAGKTVLIDGGPPEAGADLAAFIAARTKDPVDLVLLSHRHADHLGGLAAVIEKLGARMYMDAPFPHPSPLYAALLRVLGAKGIPVRAATAGRAIDLGGGATLTLLGPPDPVLRRTRSDVNSNSVVARLDYREMSVLFTGDAERPTERWLLAVGRTLRATVLKVAHHGSKHSSTAALLRAVAPRAAVVSAAAHNDYGHPAPATLARLAAAGARVWRTDRDGTITLETDGRSVEIRSSRGGEKVTIAP